MPKKPLSKLEFDKLPPEVAEEYESNKDFWKKEKVPKRVEVDFYTRKK